MKLIVRFFKVPICPHCRLAIQKSNCVISENKACCVDCVVKNIVDKF